MTVEDLTPALREEIQAHFLRRWLGRKRRQKFDRLLESRWQEKRAAKERAIKANISDDLRADYRRVQNIGYPKMLL